MTTAATAPPLGSEADAEPEVGSNQPGSSISVLHGDYFEQILPETPVVCGLRLKPLSIGRYRLMSRHKVAFVADSVSPATAGDLLMGVLICSMTCADFAAFVTDKHFQRELDRWSRLAGFLPPRYLSWPILGWLFRKFAGEAIAKSDAAYLLEQMQVFKHYISAHSQAPPHWNESEDGRVSASHWSQSIEATLREYQGWTKDEIDEEPLPKALWDYFKHMENHGLARLMTDEERIAAETPEPPEKLSEYDEWLKKIEAAKALEAHGQ